MNIVVIREKLKEGLDIISRSGGEGSQLPILKNVLIEAEEGKITLVATNLEIATTCIVPGKVIEGGKITVPLNLLSGMISALQNERINLTLLKDNFLEVKSDNYKAKLQGVSAEDFPIIPKIGSKENKIELESGILKEALSQVVISTQYSEIRPELNNILVSFRMDTLVFAATDGFRLSEKTLTDKQFKTETGTEYSCLVPLKTASELVRILKESGSVKIYKDESQILIETDQWECISRLSEGNFPDYKAIIPKGFAAEVVVSRNEFMDAVKITSVLSSKVNEVALTLENEKAIQVFSGDLSSGENDYILSAKVKGKFKQISFNWRYLNDGLKALKGGDVYLGLNDENKAALIKVPNEPSYFYILMPILKG